MDPFFAQFMCLKVHYPTQIKSDNIPGGGIPILNVNGPFNGGDNHFNFKLTGIQIHAYCISVSLYECIDR